MTQKIFNKIWKPYYNVLWEHDNWRLKKIVRIADAMKLAFPWSWILTGRDLWNLVN